MLQKFLLQNKFLSATIQIFESEIICHDCILQRKTNSSSWIQIPNHQLVYFSAAYEDVSPTDQRVVRLLAFKRQSESLKNGLICIGHYATSIKTLPYRGFDELLNVGSKSEYEATLITCPLPPNDFKQLPNAISIFPFGTKLSAIQQNLSSAAEVVPWGSGKKSRLTICVSPIYEYCNRKQFLLFLQHYLLQGAEKFVFHQRRWDDEIEKVLRYWRTANPLIEIEIVPWPLIPELIISDGFLTKRIDINEKLHYYGQNLAINHCVLKERFRSRFVASIDVDELIFCTRSKISIEELSLFQVSVVCEHKSQQKISLIQKKRRI